MPAAYPERSRLKMEIAARIGAGERLTAICAEAGMPTSRCVGLWARSDPAFAAELALARIRGDWRRRLMFDEAKARAIVARVAAGEPLVSILRGPDMPSRAVFSYWRGCNRRSPPP